MSKKPASPLTRKELRRALRAWQQAATLGSNPLAGLQIVAAARQAAGYADTPTGWGMALRSVLQAALHRLRPGEGDPRPEDQGWRDFLILTEQYIDGRAKGPLAEDLHIAPSTYDHAQAAALDRMLQLLREWEESGAVFAGGALEGGVQPLKPPPTPFMAPPRLTPGLVGRDELLLKLKRLLLEANQAPSLALHGLPGVGKTALAVELCHDPEVRSHYPDGVLWAGFGSQSDAGVLLRLWELALGFGPEELASLPGAEERAKAIHAAIGTRRMLLVLDDVWQAQPANLLRLGGPNCGTLFTTRMPGLAHELAGENVVAVPELDEAASLELLSRLAPQLVSQLPQRAQELLDASGGLPLALDLLGRALRKELYGGQPRRLIEALDRLRDPSVRIRLGRQRSPIEQQPGLPPETAESLEAVIALSEQALDEEAQEAFFALSAFPPKPNSFDELALSAVTGKPIQAIDRLVDAGLVEGVEPDRFAVQRIISDYARLRSTDDGPRRAYVEHYLGFIQAHQKAFPSLDREIHNLLAALEAAQQAGPDVQFIKAANSLFPYMESAGLLDQAEVILGQAHSAAQEVDDQTVQAEVLVNLGRTALRLAKLPEAAERFQEGLRVGMSMERAEIRCACLQGLGSVEFHRGESSEAEARYTEGLQAAEEAGLGGRQAALLSNLGVLASTQGNAPEAERRFRQGLALARDASDPPLLATLLTNLGAISAQANRLDEAEAFFQESLDLALVAGNRRAMTFLLANLGALAHDQGDDQRARVLFGHALEQARAIGDRARISHILANLGALATAGRDFEGAQLLLREGLDLARTLDQPENLILLLINSGQLVKEQGDLETALRLTQEALERATASGHARYAELAHAYLDELQSLDGN